MKRMKGFTLIELLIVVAIIAILAAIAVPNFLEAQVRSKVSRVRTDHRSLATAIEAYYVDNNSYPAVTNTNTGNQSAYSHLIPTAASLTNVRTFRLRASTNNLLTLTTPIAYITSYFPDPFADTKGATFMYFASFNGTGWILGSWGPDTDQKTGGQLEWNAGTLYQADPTAPGGSGTGPPAVETAYDPRVAQPSAFLLTDNSGTGTGKGAYTYDPTNGTVSAGDLWRVKQ